MKNLISFMTRNVALLFILLVSIVLYTLSFKGMPGNPTPYQIEYEQSSSGKPFETSQERSRWALILSLYNEHSFAIDKYASMGTPDIGYVKDHYYSFFPPGVSIIALPFYSLGQAVGNSQIVVFTMPIFFTLGTMILIYLFCRNLKMINSISILSALSYGFATSAWGYSTTLFSHTLSAFFILLGLYLTVFDDRRPVLKAFGAWFVYAVLLYIDFPNVFLYMPVAIALSLKVISVNKINESYVAKIKPKYTLAALVLLFAALSYGYYNFIHFGHPLYLSNTIPRVRDLKVIEESAPEKYRNAGQGLNTRNMLTGLYVFSISSDRGLLIYSPVILLFVFGIGYFSRENKKIEVLLISIPAVCLVLYSMFGDPWGGWAFGSRYMVAVMPELLILAALGLHRFYNRLLVVIFYNVVTVYSAGIVLLAAITTNVVPPQIEASQLGLESSYLVNWNMITSGSLSSYFYNYVLNSSITALNYYLSIFASLILLFSILIWYPKLNQLRKIIGTKKTRRFRTSI